MNEYIEKYIDLSGLPRKGKLIDWKNTIGYTCKFIYDDIVGELTITDYKNRYITVEFNGNKSTLLVGSFTKGSIGYLLNRINKGFKIEINTTFVGEKRNITIIERELRPDKNGKMLKWYKYRCNICGWDEGWNSEYHILGDIGCSCCNGKTVVKGINDIATVHPELIKYFVNECDAYMTTSCNRKEILMKCPNCGIEKTLTTEILSTRGFACEKCGDGTSYGEKYIYSLLTQLNIEFITEYNKKQAKWCKNYRYDFYIPKFNALVEVNGAQHYLKSRMTSGKYRGYKEEQKNDILKEELAKANGIKYYIVLNAEKSKSLYLKNSILNSRLPELFNFSSSDVDWDKCIEYTATSKIVDVCNYKNNNMELSTSSISKVFHVHSTTIQRYLQKGSELGICLYDLEEEKRRRYSEYRNDSFRRKPILCKELSLYFNSSALCEINSNEIFNKNMFASSIKGSIRGKRKYKGFTFSYITRDEFNNLKQNPSTSHQCYGDYFILPTTQPTPQSA